MCGMLHLVASFSLVCHPVESPRYISDPWCGYPRRVESFTHSSCNHWSHWERCHRNLTSQSKKSSPVSFAVVALLAQPPQPSSAAASSHPPSLSPGLFYWPPFWQKSLSLPTPPAWGICSSVGGAIGLEGCWFPCVGDSEGAETSFLSVF